MLVLLDFDGEDDNLPGGSFDTVAISISVCPDTTDDVGEFPLLDLFEFFVPFRFPGDTGMPDGFDNLAAVSSGVCRFCGNGKAGHLLALNVFEGDATNVALKFDFVQKIVHGVVDYNVSIEC